MAKNEDLLKEIRDNFDYDMTQWRPIRDEGRLDMKCVAGDPWPEDERKFRKDNDRLCLTFDELQQYVNQLSNSVKQNKRAIKVTPEGEGANDKTAIVRAAMIRQIEYKSNAQSAYTTAFDSAVQRSYGYFRIVRKYVGGASFDQELAIERVPNPDVILLDQDCKEADCSDMEHAFVLETMTKEKFKRKWPKAEVKDFTPEMQQLASAWIKDTNIQVAEYWKLKHDQRTLIELLEDGRLLYLDELPSGSRLVGKMLTTDGSNLRVHRSRLEDERAVCKYITNGVENLEEEDWPGSFIPIIPVFGKEIYIDRGGGTKRELMSLVRLAREPFLAYCITRTAEHEAIAMSPRTPYVGYEGQFATNTEWAELNRIPVAFAEVKGIMDATGLNVLPLPRREAYDPPVNSLEIAAEADRRAIQAAMGITALPTAAQRNNQKSGVALEKIVEQTEQGSFHFIDNFNMAIEQAGRILNELLDKIYDTEGREVAIRTDEDAYERKRLNAPDADVPNLSDGKYGVTISAGPSYASQREEANAFIDTLASNAPEIFMRVADLAVKARNLGPLGDKIAARLVPPEYRGKDGEPMDERAAEAIREAQGQVEQMQAALDELKQKIEELEVEKKGRLIEAETKKEIAMIQAQVDKFKAVLDAHVKSDKTETDEEVGKYRADIQKEIALIDAAVERFKVENQPDPAPATQ